MRHIPWPPPATSASLSLENARPPSPATPRECPTQFQPAPTPPTPSSPAPPIPAFTQTGGQAHHPSLPPSPPQAIYSIMSSFCTFFFAATHFYHAESNFLIMTSANRLSFVGCVFVTLFVTLASRARNYRRARCFPHSTVLIEQPAVKVRVARRKKNSARYCAPVIMRCSLCAKNDDKE